MSDSTYGHRRVHAQLARWGVAAGGATQSGPGQAGRLHSASGRGQGVTSSATEICPSVPRGNTNPANAILSLVDPAVGQSDVHRPVPTPVHPLGRRLRQRHHPTTHAQHRVRQLEQRIPATRQRLMQLHPKGLDAIPSTTLDTDDLHFPVRLDITQSVKRRSLPCPENPHVSERTTRLKITQVKTQAKRISLRLPPSEWAMRPGCS